MALQTHWVDDTLPYTGDALANHWIYKNFGILGDTIVAFHGPCTVNLEKMVDLEDVLNDDHIHSQHMLHFIVEVFGASLREGVLLQRLYTSILQHKLNDLLDGHLVERRGDDLFVQQTKKLSVSICTVSPTSILIHTGLNIDGEGAPVEAAGLSSTLGLSAEQIKTLAKASMNALSDEWKDIRLATCKVRAVHSI
ncbi:MAG: DUF366 family protein [Vampirovibrionales bacterium]